MLSSTRPGATGASAGRFTTLADVLIPAPTATQPFMAALRGVLLMAGGAALTALAAQLAFTAPWTAVPYTGQTAAVLLVGTALGPRLGAGSMLLYVLAGAAGIPVYAGGESGMAQLIGATGGYLIGFVVAAALVGWLATRRWDRSPATTAALMAGGNLVIYAIGVPVLAIVVSMPLTDALVQGALVFLPWDIAKVVVATALLPLAWKLTGRRGA